MTATNIPAPEDRSRKVNVSILPCSGLRGNPDTRFRTMGSTKYAGPSMKRSIAIFALILLGSGCAPEPTEPATTSLAGTWNAKAHLFSLSNFRLEMIQEPQGIVSGQWFADGDGGGGGCLPETPCKAFGNLIGRNTVSQIEIELLGAGRFEGVLRSGGTMRGIFSVQDSYDTITFARTSTTISANRVTGN